MVASKRCTGKNSCGQLAPLWHKACARCGKFFPDVAVPVFGARRPLRGEWAESWTDKGGNQEQWQPQRKRGGVRRDSGTSSSSPSTPPTGNSDAAKPSAAKKFLVNPDWPPELREQVEAWEREAKDQEFEKKPLHQKRRALETKLREKQTQLDKGRRRVEEQTAAIQKLLGERRAQMEQLQRHEATEARLHTQLQALLVDSHAAPAGDKADAGNQQFGNGNVASAAAALAQLNQIIAYARGFDASGEAEAAAIDLRTSLLARELEEAEEQVAPMEQDNTEHVPEQAAQHDTYQEVDDHFSDPGELESGFYAPDVPAAPARPSARSKAAAAPKRKETSESEAAPYDRAAWQQIIADIGWSQEEFFQLSEAERATEVAKHLQMASGKSQRS